GGRQAERALRRRVAELERLLADRGLDVSNAVAQVSRIAPEGDDRRDPRAWLENLRRSDPERFTQMTNRIAGWRRRRLEKARSAISFLSSIDTSRMSENARKTHERLQDEIARRQELEERLHQEGLSDEERHEVMQELRETHHRLMRLNGEERGNLIAETAKNLGFEGDDVKEIAATIQDVIRATDGGFGPPPGGGPREAPPPPRP
ncbi:MAG: hypothetical protein J6T51_05345, partial [Kiritimatiellae bacterium]|nr:hypothetical protein [Kiritimatiellia bacterium]